MKKSGGRLAPKASSTTRREPFQKQRRGATSPASRLGNKNPHDELREQNESLKQAQLELETSRQYYSDFFTSAPVGFLTLTHSGVIRDLNLTAARLLGAPYHDRLVGWPFVGLVADDDKQAFLAHLLRCRATADPSSPISVPLQLTGQRGQFPISVELVSFPSTDTKSSGRVFKSVLRDITQTRQLQKNQSLLAAIVESCDVAIIGLDLRGKILSANKGASALYGYSTEELIGQPIAMLLWPDQHDQWAQILWQIRAGENIDHYETFRRRKDGARVDVLLTISPIRDNDGKIVGASKISQDITQRKNAEKALAEVLEREKMAIRAKDDFLAALSHELRTPLNPVLLLASAAATNTDLPTAVRADFDAIRKNVELEVRLMDDLLDLTRITCHKLVLNRSELDVHAVLQDAIATVQNDLEQKPVIIQVDLQAKLHRVFGDPVRLQQVFWNILKNAIKFTPAGGTISVKTSVSAGNLVVKISDTGIGMERAQMGRLFKAFSQISQGFGGLGLGLAITHALVEAHAGSVHAESDGQDKGSTFCIKLPLFKSAEQIQTAVTSGPSPAITATAKAVPTGIHILLVEDHEPTRAVLVRLLALRHYRVAAADSLSAARALMKKTREHFHLVISDIALPDGNGYELMKEIRNLYPLKGIALTGYGSEKDLGQSREAGFCAHLIKPVRVDLLEKAIAEALQT